LNARKGKTGRRAIGYIRVSTPDQADHGVGLEAQESRIKDWCMVNGYVLSEVLVDRGLSGGRADNRPTLQEALATVRRGDLLIVYNLSRLARSTRDTLEIADALDRRGADLVSLSEKIDTTSAAGRMVFRLLAVLAEFERDVISERTSMAMNHMRACGRYTGGPVPFGFQFLEIGILEPVPDEQAVINRAQVLHEEGKSLRAIGLTLGQEGHRSRTGRSYLPEQIRRMLRQEHKVACL
jgi:DNA invertase Pin-like site-specific DNA recombinase